MMHTIQDIHPAEIGFDFDGVIADTAEAFIRLACEKHEYCGFSLSDITNFEIEDCITIPNQLVDRIFHEIMEDSLATGVTPLDEAVATLGMMANFSTITVITARHLEQPVIDWFDAYFPKDTCSAINLVVTGDHDDKLRHIRQHKLQYFVDDRAMTCIELAKNNITPIVYSQPWNRNRHDLPSVENWQEIEALLRLPSYQTADTL